MADSETAPEAAEAAAPEAQPAPSAPDPAATLEAMKANDRARVLAQQEATKAKAERDAFAAQLAEYESQNKSELEKALDKAKAADERAAKAEAKAERIRLSSEYKLAVEQFGDADLPPESVLANLEKTLAKAAAKVEPAPEREPIIDLNRARPSATTAPVTSADLLRQITEMAPMEHPDWYRK